MSETTPASARADMPVVTKTLAIQLLVCVSFAHRSLLDHLYQSRARPPDAKAYRLVPAISLGQTKTFTAPTSFQPIGRMRCWVMLAPTVQGMCLKAAPSIWSGCRFFDLWCPGLAHITYGAGEAGYLRKFTSYL